MLKKIRNNNKLTHTVKFQYVTSLKLACDKDIDWLYEVTKKEYEKRFKIK